MQAVMIPTQTSQLQLINGRNLEDLMVRAYDRQYQLMTLFPAIRISSCSWSADYFITDM